jgi:hypothetical protein
MFYIQRTRISADQSRLGDIVFECSIQNRANRQATLISQECELWLTGGMGGGEAQFLSRLSPDLISVSSDAADFGPQSARGVKLIWHFTPSQLELIEASRKGKEPHFELRSRLLVRVRHHKVDGTPFGDAHYVQESAFDSDTNACPIRFKIDHVGWAKILDDVGFRHIVLQELSIPTFPPAFGRADNHLKDAWNHHRAGREDAALMSCFKAFECLGFSIVGAEITRANAVAHLMSGQDEAKRKSIEAIWETLTRFCHLGRHDRGAPVQLTHADGELAVVLTTMLLSYLAAP